MTLLPLVLVSTVLSCPSAVESPDVSDGTHKIIGRLSSFEALV